MKTILVACGTAILVSLALSACGDDKDDKKDEAKATPTPTATTGTVMVAEKPESYSACVGCHGADGEGLSGPKLKGTSLSEAEFKAIVKNGKGTMGAGLATETEAGTIWKWASGK